MTEPREPRPGNNSERESNEAQSSPESRSERGFDFSRLEEDRSVTGAPNKFFTHPDHPNTLFRKEYYGDSTEAQVSVHHSEAILRDYEKKGIDVVPHVPVGVDTSTGDAVHYTAVEKVDGAKSLNDVAASSNVSDSLAAKIDHAGKAIAEQLTEAVKNGGEVNPELSALRQLAVAPASPDKPGEQRLVYIDVEATNPETVPQNEGTWKAGYDSVMQAAIVLAESIAEVKEATGREFPGAESAVRETLAALPIQGMPEAVQQTRDEVVQALERTDTETFASMAMDNEETDSSKGQAWRDHIESGEMQRVYTADFSNSGAHVLFKVTGERVFGELTAEQEEKVREYDEKRIAAYREQEGRGAREGREQEGPEGPSRGDDDEGGAGMPVPGPENPQPDPTLPQALGVSAEPVQELEKEARERGNTEATPEGEAQQREPGENGSSTAEEEQIDTAQPGMTEQEAQTREREFEAARQRALELADAAGRGEIPETKDKGKGVEKDGVGETQTPVAELTEAEKAKVRELEALVGAAREVAGKGPVLELKPGEKPVIQEMIEGVRGDTPQTEKSQGITREPELTPSQKLALEALRDAANPPASAREKEQKGLFGKFFGKSKEERGRPEIEPGGMKPLPDRKSMNPAERAAFDRQNAMARALEKDGLDPRLADQIATGLSAGGPATLAFDATVNSRASEIAARLREERGIGEKGKESRAIAEQAAQQARTEALGAVAEGANATARAAKEAAQAKEIAAREQYDRENHIQVPSVKEVAGLVAAGHETPEQRAKRLDARAIEAVRTQGLEKDPEALRRERALLEREDKDQQGQGRGRGGKGGQEQARGQGREMGDNQ